MKPAITLPQVSEDYVQALSRLFIGFQYYEAERYSHVFHGTDPTFSEIRRVYSELFDMTSRGHEWRELQVALRKKAKERLEARLNSFNNRAWRLMNTGAPLMKLRELKEFGAAVAKVISGSMSSQEFIAFVLDNEHKYLLLDVIGRIGSRFDAVKKHYCPHCGQFHRTTDGFVEVDNDIYCCPVCRDALLVYSRHMERYIRQGSARPVYLTESAYVDIEPDDFITTEYYQSYSEELVATQDYNGNICFVEDEAYEGLFNSGRIPHSGDPVIGTYHSSKSQLRTFLGKRTNGPFMGMELEVEACPSSDKEPRARAVLRELGNVNLDGKHYKYCATERDGSLDHGFEIVTAPCTLDVHRSHLTNLQKCISGLKSHDTSTCGLHVHIEKKGTTLLQRGKIVSFINDERNKALVTAVARRYKKTAGYAKVLKKTLLDGQEKYAQDRYVAVNLTNRDTIEFRIFKGTLRYESVMACLEFTKAVWLFTRDAGFNELTTQHFLEWVQLPRNMEDTRYLRQILFEKCLLTCNRQPVRGLTSSPVNEE